MSQTVYVVQETPHDLSPALRFGEIVILMKGDQPHNAAGASLSARARNVAHALRNFNPERDYLLLIGDPLNIALVSGILSRRFSVVRTLKWDRREARYLPTAIIFPLQRNQHD